MRSWEKGRSLMPEDRIDCRRGLDLAGGLRTELMDVQGMASGFAVCTASDSWTRQKRLATAVRERTELKDKDGRRRGDRLLATPRASGKSGDVGEGLEAERADFETATQIEGRKLMVFRIDLRCGVLRQGRAVKSTVSKKVCGRGGVPSQNLYSHEGIARLLTRPEHDV
jgi:hypothetical protein